MIDRGPIGNERHPDYQFSLANERNYLAWIRTALALIAGAVALQQFGIGIADARVRTLVSAILATLAVVLAVGAHRRWARIEEAFRLDQVIPPAPYLRLCSVALGAIGLVLVVLFVLASPGLVG